jgi:hypothetical protein
MVVEVITRPTERRRPIEALDDPSLLVATRWCDSDPVAHHDASPAHRSAVARVEGVGRTAAVEDHTDAAAIDGDDPPRTLPVPHGAGSGGRQLSPAGSDGDVIVPLVLEGFDIDARHGPILPSHGPEH